MTVLKEADFVVEEKTGRKPGFGSRPPSEGLCRRCGRMKPVNRLMLCYPCWVKTELEKKGWRPGDGHPSGCDCDMAAEHGSGGPKG